MACAWRLLEALPEWIFKQLGKQRKGFYLLTWIAALGVPSDLQPSALVQTQFVYPSATSRHPSGWCREQFNAPSAVLSSSWRCYVTKLSWLRGTGTLRGQTVLATSVTMGKRDRPGYGWGACTVEVQ